MFVSLQYPVGNRRGPSDEVFACISILERSLEDACGLSELGIDPWKGLFVPDTPFKQIFISLEWFESIGSSSSSSSSGTSSAFARCGCIVGNTDASRRGPAVLCENK